MSDDGALPFAGRTLHLLPLALQAEDLRLVSWLGSALARSAGVLAVQDSPIPIDREWLDPDRGQCSSNRIVDALIARAHGRPEDQWTLAVTAADLYAPGRDFVFGEATLGGEWAVVSLARFRGPQGPDDDEILCSRLLVEALHELGHLAGLGHCSERSCAMARAADPIDVDRKSPHFCPGCRTTLRNRVAHGGQHT